MKLPNLSAREPFWLVIIVALALGWRFDHQATQSELATCYETLERANTALERAKAICGDLSEKKPK
jgi:hypothetical protein